MPTLLTPIPPMRHLAFRLAIPCAAAENVLGLLAAIETLSNIWAPVPVPTSLVDFGWVALAFG
jgi:hypothetical protein